MRVLGIETSCDETSLAVLKVTPRHLNLESFIVSSQIKLHAPWGGVVPELAARRHAEIIIPLLHETLSKAKIKGSAIDLIAVTAGPGLVTALQVGVETAKTLAYVWHKPILGVNHITGHLISPFLSKEKWQLAQNKKNWPGITLVVSGGHTELYLMKSLSHWKLLGKTLDDAAGEAFDKVAKMLKLPYPGGPQVAKLARDGNVQAFNFPRPMLKNNNYDFSFAGLKTSVLYTLNKIKKINNETKADICASFQQAAIEVLVAKTIKAALVIDARSILVVGGVSANQKLRAIFKTEINKYLPRANLMFPDLQFTGDNAAMISLAAAVKTNLSPAPKLISNWKKIAANSNWELWH